MVSLKTMMVVLFILQDALGHEGGYLWCYECGTGVVGEPDCLAFSMATSWRPFWRKCPGDSVCVKTMPGWDISDEKRAVRGCTPKVSLSGSTHEEGCWSHSSSASITCYCTSNLCNGAPGLSILHGSLLLVSSLLLITLYSS